MIILIYYDLFTFAFYSHIFTIDDQPVKNG